jgi:hypothetical protein
MFIALSLSPSRKGEEPCVALLRRPELFYYIFCNGSIDPLLLVNSLSFITAPRLHREISRCLDRHEAFQGLVE